MGAGLRGGFPTRDFSRGGLQKLDGGASQWALQGHIAEPLRMGILEAAAGIRRIVDIRMADEVRVFAAKRGVDLTAFTRLPFGAAGTVPAAAVGGVPGRTRILGPPRPRPLSALGPTCPAAGNDEMRSAIML